MSQKQSQREKVAHLLRARGAAGVHTFELRQAYIANPSERIADLEREGWDIQHTGEKLHGSAWGVRYVKVSEPDVERDGGTPAPVPSGNVPATVSLDTGTLFPVDAPRTRPHWQDAAA